MKEKTKEILISYLFLELQNYATMPYEIFLIGFTFWQSFICRIFASITDLILLYYFFNTKVIWNPKKNNNSIKHHLLGGLKLAIQSPPVYALKIVFVNLFIIPFFQKLGSGIEIIKWNDVGLTLIISVIFCFVVGFLYSLFRKQILNFYKKIIKKITDIFKTKRASS